MSNYKTFAGAFGKVFLGAVLTYQIIYWMWLKLETDEVLHCELGHLANIQVGCFARLNEMCQAVFANY